MVFFFFIFLVNWKRDQTVQGYLRKEPWNLVVDQGCFGKHEGFIDFHIKVQSVELNRSPRSLLLKFSKQSSKKLMQAVVGSSHSIVVAIIGNEQKSFVLDHAVLLC